MNRANSSSRLLGAAAAAVLTMALSGCIGAPSPTPSETPTTTPSPSASPTEPSASPSEPTPSQTPEEAATPFDVDCDAIISPQQMYDFNPNFVLLNDVTPAAGSPAAQANEWHGTVCRWMHGTSGDTIDITVAAPAAEDYAQTLLSAQSGEPIAGVPFESFFSVHGAVGTAQAFTGSLWVTVSSVYFASPHDVVLLLDWALASVR